MGEISITTGVSHGEVEGMGELSRTIKRSMGSVGFFLGGGGGRDREVGWGML